MESRGGRGIEMLLEVGKWGFLGLYMGLESATIVSFFHRFFFMILDDRWREVKKLMGNLVGYVASENYVLWRVVYPGGE